MKCPRCGSIKIKVKETRFITDCTSGLRVYTCSECGETFYTEERIINDARYEELHELLKQQKRDRYQGNRIKFMEELTK